MTLTRIKRIKASHAHSHCILIVHESYSCVQPSRESKHVKSYSMWSIDSKVEILFRSISFSNSSNILSHKTFDLTNDILLRPIFMDPDMSYARFYSQSSHLVITNEICVPHKHNQSRYLLPLNFRYSSVSSTLEKNATHVIT